MKRVLITFLAITMSSLLLNAQLVDPVKWSFSSKKISDTEFDLVFKAQIDVTWHLYSVNKSKDDLGPLPTVINVDSSEFFVLVDSLREEPVPEKVYDEMFGMDVQFHAMEATFYQRIKVIKTGKFSVTGSIEGQVCDDHQCSLVESDFDIPIKADKAAEATPLIQEKKKVDDKPNIDPRSPVDLGSRSLWSLFFIAFLAGLIALLTPCVFPMIPMTVSFFMHGNKSKRRSRFEGLFFGASIVAIFTVIGTLVAILFGPGVANFMSTHWIPNVFFFLIFMFFAAWFFGMFEINLPNWMISRSDQQADKGGLGGPFFMAFTTVLVSFSCTGPIVGTILVQVAGGNVVEPIIGMLGFSLAFALPFTLFALFPSWLSGLPKSGGWLNSVKVVLGFVEMALGLKFLSIADQTYHWGILDREVYLALWIVIFTLMGFYLLGKIRFKHDSEIKYVSVGRLLLVVITFSFVVYLIPGMIGAPLKALSGYLPPMESHDFDLHQIIRDNSGQGTAADNPIDLCEKPRYADQLSLPHGLHGYFDYDQAMDCAKQLNKPLFVDFTGHGCVNCREMEANVWSDPRVLKRLKEDYVVVALYVDDKKIKLDESEWVTSSYDGKVKKTLGKKYADFQISRFGTNSQPYYVLLDHNGELLVSPRAYDLDIDKFIDFLDNGKTAFISGGE